MFVSALAGHGSADREQPLPVRSQYRLRPKNTPTLLAVAAFQAGFGPGANGPDTLIYCAAKAEMQHLRA